MLIKKTRIWRLFSSVKLAVCLIAVIVICSLVGTVIPQNETPPFYIEKVGQVGYGVLTKTGLNNVYSSWWFILLLTLLSLSLIVSLINRLPLKIRSIGTFAAHLGILAILLGALVGILWGQKGLIKICKGEERSSFISKGRKVDLGFSIRLDDFVYTEHIDPKEKLLVYAAEDKAQKGARVMGNSEPQHDPCCVNGGMAAVGGNGRLLAEMHTKPGPESDITDTGYRIKILRYVNDFAMDTATGAVSNRSVAPANPAIQVRLTDKAGQASAFWVFARFPDMHRKVDQKFKFIYRWMPRQPEDFVSRVVVLKGATEVIKKDIRVNDPLSFGGYKFFQSTYDTEFLGWSGLQAVKDPGVPLVYAGFLLLIAGIAVIFYANPITKGR